jgi:hypothetical protein
VCRSQELSDEDEIGEEGQEFGYAIVFVLDDVLMSV